MAHLMRTSIDIDDGLMAKAMAAGPYTTQKNAVEAGLELLALQAAPHHRDLRRAGVTPRSSLDVLVASFRIEHDHLLPHRDRDFEAFEPLRGPRGCRH